MSNPIARDYSFAGLIRFTMPTVLMMVVSGLYAIVDTIFVARYLGTNPLSSINIVYPVMNVLIALGVMLAAGGSAGIAKKLGRGEKAAARQDFTLITLTGLAVGVVCTVLGLVFLEPMIRALGSGDILFADCRAYLYYILLFAVPFLMQQLFQTFFVTAGHPVLGMALTIGAGVANVVLDYVFLGVLGTGIEGAAIATGSGCCIPVVVGLLFFMRRGEGLCFVRPAADWHTLAKACVNGSSEMISNLSIAVTTFLFNIILMRMLGENGVAAVTIMLYAQFLLTAVFLGFSIGVAPLVSFNYGAGNWRRLLKILRQCVVFVGVASVLVFALSVRFAQPMIAVFTPRGSVVFDLTLHGFLLFAISFLFTGVNIFTASFYAALSKGRVSGTLSFVRTFVLLVAGLFILPVFWGVDGVWLAVPAAEILCLLPAVLLLLRARRDISARAARTPAEPALAQPGPVAVCSPAPIR